MPHSSSIQPMYPSSSSNVWNDVELRPAKRPRESGQSIGNCESLWDTPPSSPSPSQCLVSLCRSSRWTDATQRAITHPEEATWSISSSGTLVSQQDIQKPPFAETSLASTSLALACRKGATLPCIKAILEASPIGLRRSVASYGTPLHEAIVCDQIGSDAIALLLRADEALDAANVSNDENEDGRATLMQDVDGNTPLHLLIRRRFQSHMHGQTAEDDLMVMLRLLVNSCPDAVGIPDRGEYEESPLVMALKTNLYTGEYDPNDVLYTKMERRVHEMVQIMLSLYPKAASMVLKGARGQYTPLHSAVFHGRCSDTIKLVLHAEAKCKCQTAIHNELQSHSTAALLANTQGELPFHFAAMRGEPPRSFFFLAEAAPEAVLKQDASGLTPLHWLWIRFVTALLALDDRSSRSNNTSSSGTSVPVKNKHVSPSAIISDNEIEQTMYNDFCSLERGDFHADLKLLRKLDPPVDFLRMRHIPPELLGGSSSSSDQEETQQQIPELTDRSVDVLKRIRIRHNRRMQQQVEKNNEQLAPPPEVRPTTRETSINSALATTASVIGVRECSAASMESSDTTEHIGYDNESCSERIVRMKDDEASSDFIVWTRIEAVTALFWTKVVSLLRAAHMAEHMNNFDRNKQNGTRERNKFYLVHTALASTCCPPRVSQIATGLFPHELSIQDDKGRLPLHYAACRSWECCSSKAVQEGGMGNSSAAKFLKDESLHVLQHAMLVSPPHAARITDNDGRLVLHHTIDNFVRACSNGRSYYSNMALASGASGDTSSRDFNPVRPMLDILHSMLQMFPGALERRDGKSKLYPFLQATAAATQYRSPPSPNGFSVPFPDEMPLSIVYLLLRENPSVLSWGIQ